MSDRSTHHFTLVKEIHTCTLHHKQKIQAQINLCVKALGSILVVVMVLGGIGCDDDHSDSQEINEIFSPCMPQEIFNEDGVCVPRETPAHPPQCITVDGPLCLIGVTLRDGAPRPGALTPGEASVLGEMMIFNSGDDEIQLTRLSALVTSPHLTLNQPDWSREPVTGVAWFDPERTLSISARDQVDTSCARGLLPAHEGCTINLELPFSVSDDAPVNASQRIELASESQLGARFSWSFPLNIVDAVAGLDLEEVSFVESTEDGHLQPGDRVRFETLKLVNHSFAPFVKLRGLLTDPEHQVEFLGETERWMIENERIEGITSAEIYCPQATSDETRSMVAGVCQLSFEGIVQIKDDLEVEELTLMLYLQDRETSVSVPTPVRVELVPWEPQLVFGGLQFERDDNRDLLPSAGERMIIRYITLENQGDTAISLRGRVAVDSPYASLSGASDVSINETQLRDDFYENCAPQSTCELEVNLILNLNEDAPLGSRIPINLELIDHARKSYLFESQFELVLPDVELVLEEFEVTQDTLDTDLSPGERGVIRYIKLTNEGLADALDLSVTISTDSEYVVFESNHLTFRLNSHSDQFDEMESVCPSTEFEADGYCYSRAEITFRIAEDVPLGEEVNFMITVTDLWGTVHELNHRLTLF